MSLKLVSSKKIPIDLALAKEFRDMEALKGERELKSTRVKGQARLIADGNFFTAIWGKCRYKGTIHRGNGNHTSHLITACLQTTKGDMDETSESFVKRMLLTKGGKWSGLDKGDLPALKDNQLSAFVEEYTAETEDDLLTFFSRYDAREASRTPADLLGVQIGEHEDLNDLGKKKIRYVLAGILQAGRSFPTKFGFTDKRQISSSFSGGDRGLALRIPKVRRCIRWVIENTEDGSLYEAIAGAVCLAEVWANYEEEEGEQIIRELDRQLNIIDDPHKPLPLAKRWKNLLVNKKQQPSLPKVIGDGRKLITSIAREVLQPA